MQKRQRQTCRKYFLILILSPEGMSGRTVEEVALAFKYLADLKGPDLTYPWVGGMKHEGLHGAVGGARSENELAGVAFHVLLQTQTAYLKSSRYYVTSFRLCARRI